MSGVIAPRRVLVTGAGGFVGRHVLPLLVSRGYDVHATSRQARDGLSAAVTWYAADLLANGSARALVRDVRPTHLLHLAWTTRPGEFWTAPDNLDWVAASIELYRAFVAAGGKRAVIVGTCAEYDWSYELLDEATTPCNPGTLYGTAKDALHRMLRQAAQQDGVSLAWPRIFSVYGPYEPEQRLVPSVVLPLLRGEEAPCGEGIVERDFLHVEDVAAALAMILDSAWTGPVNLASGCCVPLRQIIECLAAEIGRLPLVRMGARLPRMAEPRRLAGTTARLREQLGFVPRYGLRDGLVSTVAWWRRQMRVAKWPSDREAVRLGHGCN